MRAKVSPLRIKDENEEINYHEHYMKSDDSRSVMVYYDLKRRK